MKKGAKAVIAVLGGIGIKQILRSPEEKELRIVTKEQIKDIKLQIKNKDITRQEGNEEIIDVKKQLKNNLIKLKKSNSDSDSDSDSDSE